jgi:hypothetical protein
MITTADPLTTKLRIHITKRINQHISRRTSILSIKRGIDALTIKKINPYIIKRISKHIIKKVGRPIHMKVNTNRKLNRHTITIIIARLGMYQKPGDRTADLAIFRTQSPVYVVARKEAKHTPIHLQDFVGLLATDLDQQLQLASPLGRQHLIKI